MCNTHSQLNTEKQQKSVLSHQPVSAGAGPGQLFCMVNLNGKTKRTRMAEDEGEKNKETDRYSLSFL